MYLAVVLAGATEDVADPCVRDALVSIDELYPVVGQDGVDRVGHRLDQHLEEGGCCQLGCSATDAGEDQL